MFRTWRNNKIVMKENIIDLVSQACLEFHDTGMSSTTAEARFIIGKLEKKGFEIIKKEINLNHLPNTIISLFENGETEYRYFSEESMDNNASMNWFINYIWGLKDNIELFDGTQIIVKHPNYEEKLIVDAGGLGDFFSHSFKVSILQD